MTTAQAMEEELQQSVLRSETANWETIEAQTDRLAIDDTQGSTNNTIFIASNGSINAEATVPDDATSDRDASGEEVGGIAEDEDEEEDASGEEDVDMLLEAPDRNLPGAQGSDQHDQSGDESEDQDASGEEDDEAVGAVKIQPNGLVDDADEDDDSDVSEAPSAIGDDRDSEDDEEDEEDEGEWEDARDTAGEEEEDSDAGPSNVCVFCKQDEEHDPSEEFENYLTCVACGENAHQLCAREVAAMSQQNTARKWKCPNCWTGDSESDSSDDDVLDDDANEELLRPGSQQSDVPRMARDLLAVPMGSDDGDAHSVFSELVLQDDPMDGSRLLRKRKTSSIEPDEAVVALRKRRRNPSTGTHDDDAGQASHGNENGGHRSARASRQKTSLPAPVSIEKRTRTALVLKIHVKPGNLKEILSRKRRGGRGAGGTNSRTPRRPNPTPARPVAPTIAPLMETPFAAESYAQPYYSFFDRDTDDAKGKPYGGILADAEADTSKTLPAADDRQRFDQAKQKAEEEWRARVLAMQNGADAPSRKNKRVIDHASQIECIEFGGWEIDTWYAAPYPAEYSRNRVLYICEFCLKYMNSDYVAWRHKLKCATKHPPGDEIYRDGTISMFEVDGRKNPEYCQNLCLLAKLFLGSKTLYYDVEPFLFYVLCEFDECGYHFVGYFSKEKRSSSQNNVSCILTLPIHQRKGYGNLLIDFSYLLTRVEDKTGSPEKPLSDMGLVSYRNYWRLVICQCFTNMVGESDYKQDGLSIDQISKQTGLTQDDVISALEGLRALVRDPQTKTYAFRIDIEYCRDYVAKWQAKGYVTLKPEKLAWTPYVMGRGVATQFELGPISTIAPREDEEAKVIEGPNSVGAESHPILNGVKAPSSLDDLEQVEEVKETTEGERMPDEAAPTLATTTKPGGEDDKENATPSEMNDDQLEVDSADADWRLPYEGILPNRFEIFPSVNAGRRADRSRQSLSRPSLPRAPSSISRPRSKRPGGSARRASAARPKSSSSRRKTGGTGRGPGRWPKGTKKADYGNADSGPGFPPGWTPDQKIEGIDADIALLSAEGIDLPPQDEVQVFVSTSGETGQVDKETSGEQQT